MTSPLYPWIPGLTFQRTRYAQIGKTLINESLSGKELRIVTQQRPRWNYEMIFEVMRAFGSRGDMYGQYANSNQVPPATNLVNPGALIDNEFAVLQGFMLNLQGQGGEFLYDDQADNSVGLYRFAEANGTATSWTTPFTYGPLLYIDQAYENVARVLNSFGSWAGASINGSGLVTAGVAPSVGQQLYATTRVASTASLSYPGEQFGTGDGTTVAFQLTRVMGGQATGYAEPIQNLNGAPTIWINGALQSTFSYTVGPTGIITFGAPPAANTIISWAGKFYIRLRWAKDDSKFDELLARLWEGRQVQAISVLL